MRRARSLTKSLWALGPSGFASCSVSVCLVSAAGGGGGMAFVVIGIVVVVFISGEGGGGIIIMCTLTVYSLHVVSVH